MEVGSNPLNCFCFTIRFGTACDKNETHLNHDFGMVIGNKSITDSIELKLSFWIFSTGFRINCCTQTPNQRGEAIKMCKMSVSIYNTHSKHHSILLHAQVPILSLKLLSWDIFLKCLERIFFYIYILLLNLKSSFSRVSYKFSFNLFSKNLQNVSTKHSYVSLKFLKEYCIRIKTVSPLQLSFLRTMVLR